MSRPFRTHADRLVRGVQHGLWSVGTLGWPSSGRDDDAPWAGVNEELTICFIDLEGFTALTSREGDEAASAVLADHRRMVEPIVRDCDGHVVKHLGDGALLTFPDAADAINAALDVVNSGTGPLRVRAGLHTGEVLVFPDGDVLGRVVNVAARVAEITKAGDVVVTATTAAAARPGSGIVFSRPRRRRFKGIEESVHVHRAMAAADQVPDRSTRCGAPS